MLDLFALAHNNNEKIEFECNFALTSLADQTKESNAKHFKKWVLETSRISINTSLTVVAELLRGNPYLNIHEVALSNGLSAEEYLRGNDPNGYAEKRIIFDKTFSSSDQFKYGALNGGCVGLSNYFAPYCAVLDKDFLGLLEKENTCACLPGNSLKHYFSSSNKLEIDKLTKEVTPLAQRHHAATYYRLREIISKPLYEPEEFKEILLSDTNRSFFELIFIGKLVFNGIKSIRVKEDQLTKDREQAKKLEEEHRKKARKKMYIPYDEREIIGNFYILDEFSNLLEVM